MAIMYNYNVGFVSPNLDKIDQMQFYAANEDEVRRFFRDYYIERYDTTDVPEPLYIEQVNNMEYDRIMYMSTAHISKDSCELLESDDSMAIAFPNPNGYGIIVRCSPDMNYYGAGADDVAACIDYARERGCGYIRFDRDFPAFTDLPVYDW